MSKPLKNLEPGSIYITISLPDTEISAVSGAPRLRKPVIPREIDIATYETQCAQSFGQEEFTWGYYFHRNNQDGVWYSLRRHESYVDPTATRFALDRRQLASSPRLHNQVVSLSRVLRIPHFLCEKLTRYIDWLATASYGSATRSFIWATSMFLQTWQYTTESLHFTSSKAYDNHFDVSLFLRESLHFAYADVDFAISGQLPRPILRSAFGVELISLSEQGTHKRSTSDSTRSVTQKKGSGGPSTT